MTKLISPPAVKGRKKNKGKNAGRNVVKCQLYTCQNVQAARQKFACCSRCAAPYCSAKCQKADWKLTHKRVCKQLKMLRGGADQIELDHTEIISRWPVR